MKTCTKCQLPQDESEFRKDRSTKEGLHPHCKTCYNKSRMNYYTLNKEKEQETARRSYEKNKHKHKLRKKLYSWNKTYGINISFEEYEKFIESQSGQCAICKTPATQLTKFLAVDHCHETGKIRGLLCGNCNLALGLFKDNPEILTSAIKYLS